MYYFRLIIKLVYIMYSYDPKKNLDSSINISNVKIIEGKFDYIEGLYREVSWGETQQMLFVEFENLDEQCDCYYVSNYKYNIDYQHSTLKDQTAFFFPISEDLPLEELRIYGVKFDVKYRGLDRLFGRVVGKSDLIKDSLLAIEQGLDIETESEKRMSRRFDLRFDVAADYLTTRQHRFYQSKAMEIPARFSESLDKTIEFQIK